MTLPPLSADDFPAVFKAIHGHDPFPWQARLLTLVARTGRWPAPKVLDLPTGTGKTAAIDIALFHLALEADRGIARTAPLRIAFVVDRRIIVDEAAERAERVARKLESAPAEMPLGRMAARLRSLADPGGPPLVVRILRGGLPREDDWARTPGQPTVLCSTVDQVGSRLLFRGYGVSDSMKPVHAGLLGSDCLFLLDEAHLAAPFAGTLNRIATYRAPPWCERAPGSWGFVSLSATARDAGGFGLDEEDRRHPVLKARLGAAKPARLRLLPSSEEKEAVKRSGPPDHQVAGFVTAARELLAVEGVRTLAVVVNRVALARAVFERLEKNGLDSVLLTGRCRDAERAALLDRHKARLKSKPDRDSDPEGGPMESPLVVVATQTIEAGADFDFDALVTQIAPLDALRQRFGRLNRMGRSIPAPALVLATKAETKPKPADPVYGDRLAATWKWLSGVAGKPAKKKGGEPLIDFGIDAMATRLPDAATLAALCSEHPEAPILRPADVMLLTWTSPIPAVDPAIGLFLHGPETGPADVQIVWRADLSEETLKDAGEILALAPPHAGETLALPLWTARAWLAGERRRTPDIADIEGAAVPAPTMRDGNSPVFRWAGPESERTGLVQRAEDIRAGDVIVVPAKRGGCDEHGWNPAYGDPVADLGDKRPEGRRWSLRFHAGLDNWDAVKDILARTGDLSDRERGRALRKRLSLADDLHLTVAWPEAYGDDGAIALMSRPAVPARDVAVTEDDDSGSLTGQPITLSRHAGRVADTAAAFAAAAGLSTDVAADVRLAAELHDLGKADDRFQAWLRGGDRVLAALAQADPLAKSPHPMTAGESRRAHRLAGLPERWRHEAQSVVRAVTDPRFAAARDPLLVLWLIGTHHGHGRPLFPHDDPREPDDRRGPQRLDFDFQGMDWPQLFERLKDRYGPWELARLEAVLRLADHRASEENRT